MKYTLKVKFLEYACKITIKTIVYPISELLLFRFHKLPLLASSVCTANATFIFLIYVSKIVSRLLTVVAVGRVAMTPARPSKLEEFGSAVDPRKG